MASFRRRCLCVCNGDPIDDRDPTGEFVPLVTGAIGAVAGFGGSLIGQLISNGGNVHCLSWKNAFIAGGVGAIAGAAARFVATSWLGASVLGSAANTAQYEITQVANGQSATAGGAAYSAVTGALGGVVGGRFSQPALPHSTTSPWLNPAAAAGSTHGTAWL
jgi:hypothetical protein